MRPVTTTLVLINVLAYVWEVATGTNFDDTNSLIAHGGLNAELFHDGQWWRIITAGFLHAGLAHIALNMFALYQLGTFVEAVLGSWRTLAIYSFSLVAAGYAVVLFPPGGDLYVPTVGASGAIFGLFGALIAIGLRLGKRGRSLIMQTLPILVINLVFTFAVPFISKAGHVGGLLSGFVAGFVLFSMKPRAAAPSVVDASTGEPAEAELLPPQTPA
jgi:rhomboid protease GluP